MPLFRLITSVAICTTTAFAVAEDLRVGPGKEYQIRRGQEDMTVDRLILGDGARITFADGVEYWYLSADEAEIGNRVVIEGSGKNGATGAAGSMVQTALECAGGRPGADGSDGGNGSPGVDIRLRLGVKKIGDLTINSAGGAGGAGGKGSSGQDAGIGARCKRGDGGDGGNGGVGGNGGRGGRVQVQIEALQGADSRELLSNITVVANGGKPGVGGQAGEPGNGTKGYYSNRRGPTGNRRWEAGGDPGAVGEAGSSGLPGTTGNIALVDNTPIEALTSTVPARDSIVAEKPSPAVPTTDNSAKDAEIELMRQQLKALQERLEALEEEK